jgi:putative flavoprotein involved in K+ transport
MKHFHTIVIGGGQAGLSVSHALRARGVAHVVLERGDVGASWRSRWDSFALNTPNWCSLLPGADLGPADAGGFFGRDEFVQRLLDYVREFDLPVRTGVAVTSVRREEGRFVVEAAGESMTTDHVVVASGSQNEPVTPAIAGDLGGVTQMHASGYRSAGSLPDGAVLVVGSGQSGVQIAEDLLEAGRRVYLSTSRVGRVVRRYRGKDVSEWIEMSGMTKHTVADLEDPDMRWATQPQLSGAHGGHTVSLQGLERAGAVLLGRLEGARGDALVFADDLGDNIRFADATSAEMKKGLDFFIDKAGVDAPPAALDDADQPDPDPGARTPPRELALSAVGSVIWATGFKGKFDWLECADLDARGLPMHEDGASPQEGLYYCGFQWLRTRVSGLVAGVGDDAAYIADRIAGEPA